MNDVARAFQLLCRKGAAQVAVPFRRPYASLGAGVAVARPLPPLRAARKSLKWRLEVHYKIIVFPEFKGGGWT